MTATFQTSCFAPLENEIAERKPRHSSRKALRLFQVDVENFDNEVESYEIEAHSAAEAAEIAEAQFGDAVYNMNIYEIENF
jgi:hypothetical protein